MIILSTLALQVFGTVMLAALGATFLWVAANAFRMRGMGRDMLRLIAVGQFLFVGNRIGVMVGWTGGDDAVVISGMLGAALLTAAANIVWMYYAARRHNIMSVYGGNQEHSP